MSEYLYTFKGMPEVRSKQLRGPMKDTANGFIVALRSHRICSSAGDCGAVNVYRDDDGNYRCSFMVYFSTKSEAVFKTKREVRAWLTKWLPYTRRSAR